MKIKLIIKDKSVFLGDFEVVETWLGYSTFQLQLDNEKDLVLLQLADEIWLSDVVKIIPKSVSVLTREIEGVTGNRTILVRVSPKELWKWVKV